MSHPSRRLLLAGTAAFALTPAAGDRVLAQGAGVAEASPPGMPPRRMIRTNGIRMAVHEAGSGPAVVLLHGFPGLSFTWRRQIPALAAAGYRVIVPDLRGYGATEAPDAVEAYDISELAADMTGLLDAMDIEQAVFMGHDWGGLLAWQMPMLHPDRVAGVVGVNTPFIPHWMLWLHPDLVRAAVGDGPVPAADPAIDPIAQMRRIYAPLMYVLLFQDGQQADNAMTADPRAALRNSYRKDLATSDTWGDLPEEVANMAYYGQPIPAVLPGQDVLTPAELDVYTAAFTRTGFTPAINWYRNLSRNWAAGRDLEQTIRKPGLMISAEHDVVLRPSMAADMETWIPDLESHVVPDCWHWTPEERPEELNQLALSWLRRRFPPT